MEGGTPFGGHQILRWRHRAAARSDTRCRDDLVTAPGPHAWVASRERDDSPDAAGAHRWPFAGAVGLALHALSVYARTPRDAFVPSHVATRCPVATRCRDTQCLTTPALWVKTCVFDHPCMVARPLLIRHARRRVRDGSEAWRALIAARSSFAPAGDVCALADAVRVCPAAAISGNERWRIT